MSKEYEALTALKTHLTATMDATPQTQLTASQIVIDYPDPDKMPYSVMLYIVPEGGSWERTTTETLEESLSVTVYILHRQTASINTMALLIQALFNYFKAFSNAINYDPTCGSVFDDTAINSFDFYPATSGLTNTAGLDISCTLMFERDKIILPGGGVLPGEDVIPEGD